MDTSLTQKDQNKIQSVDLPTVDIDVFNPESGLDKQYAIFEQLLSDDASFPEEVMQLQSETDRDYKFFLHYLFQGFGIRTAVAVCRAFYPERTIHTNPNLDREKISPVYNKLIQIKTRNRWEDRCRIWDNYTHKRTMTRIAYIQETAPLQAWNALVSALMDNKTENRLRAANDILDRTGFPRETSKTIDTTIRTIKSMPDAQLKQLIVQHIEAKQLNSGNIQPQNAPNSPETAQDALKGQFQVKQAQTDTD